MTTETKIETLALLHSRKLDAPLAFAFLEWMEMQASLETRGLTPAETVAECIANFVADRREEIQQLEPR